MTDAERCPRDDAPMVLDIPHDAWICTKCGWFFTRPFLRDAAR